MAQIWVTREELGSLCNCSVAEARASVRMRDWPQRRCSDGQVRLKLPEDLAYAYMAAALGGSALNRITDANVAGLESMLRGRDAGRDSKPAKASKAA